MLRRARPNNAGSAVVDSALGFVDDLAYGAGVWEGARRAKTARPLLARITRSVIAR
jgi:hypothetical protein